MPTQEMTDPYAPPPLKKDKGGRFVRAVILVGLLAVGGAVAYTVFQAPAPQTASVEDQGGPQRLADGSYAANAPPAIAPPQAAAPEAAPAPAPRATTSHRSAAPRQPAPPVEDPAPVPDATPAPATPTPPQPLPPDVTAPSASGR